MTNKIWIKIGNEETKSVMTSQGFTRIENEELGFYEVDDTEIERGYDNSWYLKGYAPVQPVQDAKDEKLLELHIANEDYIFSKYPQYKQNNLAIMGTKEKKLAFKTFKDNVVSYYDSLVLLVENATTIEEIEQIGYDCQC